MSELAEASDMPVERIWGSDAVVQAMAAVGLEYVAINPGSSFRGLHDSLVNPPSGVAPQILLCLHEEHAVAIAHGYAKVTGQPMAVGLHSNVGLMHGTMALFNAYCDRVPMVVIGAQGPASAERRRPWIDWLHTTADLGALVRPYIKWDDAPMSVPASIEAVLRGAQLTRSEPQAPVYVCLDVDVQEQELTAPCPTVAADRYQPYPLPGVSRDVEASLRSVLESAPRVVLLVGRVGSEAEAWQRRVALAERLGASVITQQRTGAGFPTSHDLHLETVTGLRLSDRAAAALRDADVVVGLEWVDLGGTLADAYGEEPVSASVVAVTLEHQLLSGWAKVDFSLCPTDVIVPTSPDAAVTSMLALLNKMPDAAVDTRPLMAPARGAGTDRQGTAAAPAVEGRLHISELQQALVSATSGVDVSLLRVPFGWLPELWPLDHPLDQLGADGGAGIGSGPGMCVGSALALQGSGRLPVGVLGDGDFLMGASALWTAARHDVPLLVVVANNASYRNDEEHQRTMARDRGRPLERADIGIIIDDPDPDLSGMARSLGWDGYGPIRTRAELDESLVHAVATVLAGGRALVDVWVQ